ncbi:YfcC family protein [Macrococcus hajekii]|uniref:YfcC family protein n=1 Tax=Macrococcus hajekii TaxID=198482 RepID=A0A4R6BLV8_9STAP|nr:Na+/H+ antiporter NhaC family protein [Macrococcus hajekii]TDM02794.1 YfcC family protein [Macrococcus hajekii]GGB03949.1 C4-dicarboxylate ABC transporter [Macrococcus hajekii]
MKKSLKMPHTYALLLFLVAFACVMTYMIPAGVYDREKVDGRDQVVNDSYHHVAQQPVHAIEIFRAVPSGLVEAAEIVFYIFIVGGAFGIIHRTDAINAGVNAMMEKTGKKGNMLIPVTMIVFSILGFSIGLSEEAIVFVPIGILLAKALGYDAMVGTAMIILGSGIGFLGGMINPFTVGVAQKIAEIPLFSGILFRSIVYVLILVTGIMYVLHYAKKVKQDKNHSLIEPEMRASNDEKFKEQIKDMSTFTVRHALILLCLVIAVVVNVFGIFKYDWFLMQMSANFLIMGIIAGLIGGLGVNGTFDALIEGMQDILYGAIIVGFARAIVLVLESGKIIDTIVYHMTAVIDHLPAAFSVVTMFITQLFLNFFIPSGSGQAMTTMPIMVPIADLLGINRQLAVLAFQYGDAISNNIIPTSASLMGALAVARIPYTTWIKFVWKIILLWTVICMISMIVYMYI